jgi:hypothetical protein
MEVEVVQQHLKTIQKQDESRVEWLQVLSHIPLISCQSLTSAKELLRTYCNTVDKLKDVITDVNNQRILNLALGRENEELKSEFEELQRSVVSRAVHQ